MSVELTDLYANGVSNCCSASVIDPSGENIEGICTDCKEHCGIVNDFYDESDAEANFNAAIDASE